MRILYILSLIVVCRWIISMWVDCHSGPKCQVCTCDGCAECGGLGHGGPEDGDAEEVGLDLHEEAVLRHAAVRKEAAAHKAQTAPSRPRSP